MQSTNAKRPVTFVLFRRVNYQREKNNNNNNNNKTKKTHNRKSAKVEFSPRKEESSMIAGNCNGSRSFVVVKFG